MIIQTIVCIKNTDAQVLCKAAVIAGMQIKDQFTEDSINFIGQHEKSIFERNYKEWIEKGLEQQIIFVEKYENIEFIELQANMEGLPINYLNDDIEIPLLVIGPCDDSKVQYYINNYK